MKKKMVLPDISSESPELARFCLESGDLGNGRPPPGKTSSPWSKRPGNADGQLSRGFAETSSLGRSAVAWGNTCFVCGVQP